VSSSLSRYAISKKVNIVYYLSTSELFVSDACDGGGDGVLELLKGPVAGGDGVLELLKGTVA